MKRDVYNLPFDGLTLPEQIIRTTSGKLVKHFRGLEDAGFIDVATASNLIGSVKKLASVALEEHWKAEYPQTGV